MGWWWEAAEGNPTATPLLNKDDTRTELRFSRRGVETPHTVLDLSQRYILSQGETRINRWRPPYGRKEERDRLKWISITEDTRV